MAFRRRRSPILIFLGLVAAVMVIVVVALPGSNSSPDKQSYLDIVRPQLQVSAQEGAVVQDIRANAPSSDRTTLVRRADDLVGGAAGVQREVSPVAPPGSLGSAGSLLKQSLSMRAQATASLRDGLQASLTGAPGDQAVDLLSRAGQQLQSGDDLYGRFLRALSRQQAASIAVPQYRWVRNPADWDRPAVRLYVLALRLSPSLAAHHDIALVLVTTQPPPTSYNGPVAILELTRRLTVGVVVANSGNVAEHGVPVVVTLASGQTQTARTTVDLDPGQRRAVDLGGLSLSPLRIYNLTVTVGPAAGEATPFDDQQVTPIAVAG